MNAAAHMDAMYAVQRHFYDVTRKPYLLGRDVLIRDLGVPQGGTVLEIGCGTARNLLRLARRYPSARCFGVDISSQMLRTARESIAREGADVRVANADATGFDPVAEFGVEKFDRVIISYALSMIPEWEAALRFAATLTADGGALHVVDFGGQDRLPGWFRKMLFGWLALFSVTPRLELQSRAAAVAQSLGRELQFRPLYRGYAALAVLRAG